MFSFRYDFISERNSSSVAPSIIESTKVSPILVPVESKSSYNDALNDSNADN